MSDNSDGMTVYVEAAARIHFGVLDLGGALGRWFGGIGAAASAPTLIVSACRAEAFEVTGEDAERAAVYAHRFLTHHSLKDGVKVHVHRALPPHSGLGSGTQLALATARAIAEVMGVTTDATDMARAVGRASRSAIGTWTFAGGGFVLEGGRRRGSPGVAPLLARLPFPESWRCVIAVPAVHAGISGQAEESAFLQLPPPSEQEVGHVAHLVLMGLLPALVEADLPAFGSALSEIQRVTGCWFAAVQGGTFARGPSQDIVRRMAEWGASGVGQSSWGPAVYGIVDGEEAGLRLADLVRGVFNQDAAVYEGPFSGEGARVWRVATP